MPSAQGPRPDLRALPPRTCSPCTLQYRQRRDELDGSGAGAAECELGADQAQRLMRYLVQVRRALLVCLRMLSSSQTLHSLWCSGPAQ